MTIRFMYVQEENEDTHDDDDDDDDDDDWDENFKNEIEIYQEEYITFLHLSLENALNSRNHQEISYALKNLINFVAQIKNETQLAL